MAMDTTATTFSLSNAQTLGQAAAIAYQGPVECRAWAEAHGFEPDSLEFFDVRDTQGFVVQNAQSVVVAFRGTQPNRPVDWLSDFEASPETWAHPVGTVHKGFYEAMRVAWGVRVNGREILPARLLGRGDRTVWITGHSLGGALAQLCAAQAFFAAHVPIQGVYTFGQPRVGDERFATLVNGAYGARVFRMVNDRDIVPRVPLFAMGYRHFGNEVFFEHAAQRSAAPASVETLAAALRFAAKALNTDPVQMAAGLITRAVTAAGIFGNHQGSLRDLVREQEAVALGDARALLESGTENIDDHSMCDCYLVRVGTRLG